MKKRLAKKIGKYQKHQRLTKKQQAEKAMWLLAQSPIDAADMTLANLNALTVKHIFPSLTDEIFKSSPLFSRLRSSLTGKR